MAIDRRRFLQLGAVSLAAIALPEPLRAGADAIYVASVAEPGGGFAALVIDESGKPLFRLPIEARGHDAAADPVRRRAVLFARRPGRFALVVEADRPSAPPLLFAPPEDRVFNGHGAFSRDGRLLYASENDLDGNGLLGLYDAGASFARIGELSTHGIGPHEVVLSPDGERLIVANGGIATDPEVGGGRHNLNLPAMAPSLVELDRRTGAVLGRWTLGAELHELSIRHLAFDASGAVWFGCQWEGDPVEHPALVGRVSRAGALDLTHIDRRPLLAARNYVGALAASRDGTLIAASCPRGGVILAFDATIGRLVGEIAAADSSGIAPAGDRAFLATSGDGSLIRIEGDSRLPLGRGRERYDNHLRRLAAG